MNGQTCSNHSCLHMLLGHFINFLNIGYHGIDFSVFRISLWSEQMDNVDKLKQQTESSSGLDMFFFSTSIMNSKQAKRQHIIQKPPRGLFNHRNRHANQMNHTSNMLKKLCIFCYEVKWNEILKNLLNASIKCPPSSPLSLDYFA